MRPSRRRAGGGRRRPGRGPVKGEVISEHRSELTRAARPWAWPTAPRRRGRSRRRRRRTRRRSRSSGSSRPTRGTSSRATTARSNNSRRRGRPWSAAGATSPASGRRARTWRGSSRSGRGTTSSASRPTAGGRRTPSTRRPTTTRTTTRRATSRRSTRASASSTASSWPRGGAGRGPSARTAGSATCSACRRSCVTSTSPRGAAAAAAALAEEAAALFHRLHRPRGRAEVAQQSARPRRGLQAEVHEVAATVHEVHRRAVGAARRRFGLLAQLVELGRRGPPRLVLEVPLRRVVDEGLDRLRVRFHGRDLGRCGFGRVAVVAEQIRGDVVLDEVAHERLVEIDLLG
mmetsp:Transcript_20342/g.67189  ORF Transcript_20342/g.67189 Transcript_20342/m.67189 type:complete len:346 (-) Transcript_20342:493-1530(-)